MMRTRVAAALFDFLPALLLAQPPASPLIRLSDFARPPLHTQSAIS
ncbi:unnamed protein product [Mycetohabitans rhizoxinica HKI 454]|uniref:Uncharacterized protein n=1 Tax=Mycetohabitans rhizoxinica (strain DSM 19002 / CIP 109453 / HKI 454) TaxID=882378 RepID=E5AND5_MYCRK|nr:unnamed protein product [Mycetohabitans rhizoxinica HKI 454]